MKWSLFLIILLISCKNKIAPPHNAVFDPVKKTVVIDTIYEKLIIIDYDTKQWKELTEKEHGIFLDLKYATNDNFTHTKIYDCDRCFLRPTLANKLILLQNKLYNKNKWSLKLYDCYRPRPAQQKLWEKVPNATYVTPPEKGSMHNRGLAVDLTIVDEKGQELDMGSEFDSFTRKSHIDYLDHTEKVRKNREILFNLMSDEDLKGIRTEWWHYSLRTSLMPISDWEWKCN